MAGCLLRIIRSCWPDNGPLKREAERFGLGWLVEAITLGNGQPVKDFCSFLEDFFARLWATLGSWLSVEAIWLVYIIAQRVPALQFITLGTQWGEDLKNLYFLFARQEYWAGQLDNTRQDAPGSSQIQNVSYLLIALLIDRLDFTIRVALTLVYGTYWLAPVEGQTPPRLPILYSNLAYLELGDSQTQVETNPDGNDSFASQLELTDLQNQGLQFISQGSHIAQAAFDDNNAIVSFLVEVAWLSYETPRLAADVIATNKWGADFPLHDPARFHCALEFTSISYAYNADKPSEKWLRPIDTQCLIFTVGNGVVLAFRGSQFEFWDWFYNFSVNSLPESKPLDLGRAFSGGHEAAGSPEGAILRGRTHGGFAANLGINLKDSRGESVDLDACTYFSYSAPPAGPLGAAGPPQPRKANMTPYAVMAEQLVPLMADPNTRLYITGHSLGGAVALLFAAMFCLDQSTARKERVYLCTFGQPLAGNQDFVDSVSQYLLPDEEDPSLRYVRVVNQNDLVARVGVFFLDTGERFLHVGRPGVDSVRYIDGGGVMSSRVLPGPFQNPVNFSWRKLRKAWGYSMGAAAPAPGFRPQSAWCFLRRVALTPIMLINDHLDYRLLLRNPGYWQ